ncbi:MAG TPA: YicC/YloC family endoribonuclease [Gemmatimonadaceae bacterium]|nr:YicC/YloC family endoribonuclease [Gemmatimonadaceae bacterium]
MTGFGAASGRVGTAEVSVELRSVNHRFFNPSLKLPASLLRWESDIREALRRRIARGHVTLTARVERRADEPAAIDEQRFGRYVEQLRGLQSRFALDGGLDVATVLRMPNVVAPEAAEEQEGTAEELLAVVGEALDLLVAMRESEGARLAEVLRERLDAVLAIVERIAARAPERLVNERERLRRSVRELADGVDVDEMRVAQELAIVADRLDVSEEIDRFRAHAAAFRETLGRAGSEPVGKRLGFLLQEMLREANTTGSKARDKIMMHEVVSVKEELERIAEQVENIE